MGVHLGGMAGGAPLGSMALGKPLSAAVGRAVREEGLVEGMGALGLR